MPEGTSPMADTRSESPLASVSLTRGSIWTVCPSGTTTWSPPATGAMFSAPRTSTRRTPSVGSRPSE